MKIILIRHAKVLLDNKQKITASQMKAWVEECVEQGAGSKNWGYKVYENN